MSLCSGSCFEVLFKFNPVFLAAPSGQDERVHDQTGLSAAHPHPPRPRNPQAAVLDPQDCALPSSAVAA